MADDASQPLQITVPRRGANVVQGLPPSEGGGSDLLGQFFKLLQPGTPGTPPDKPPTESLIQPTPNVGGAVVKGLARGTGGEEALKARSGTPKLLAPAAPLIDQFFKLVQGAGEAVQSDTVMDKSGEIGGQTVMGGATVAGLRSGVGAGEGEIGVFGGKGAKAADQTKLQRAEFMEQAGSSPEYIRKNTWWFRDVDKQWKFEIPDKGSVFTKPFGDEVYGAATTPAPTTLGAVYNHPRLYQQYPELKGSKVYWDGEPGGAHFLRSDKSIHLDPRADDATLRRQVSHEIQHWVQFEERFGLGSNPEALGTAARLVLKYKGIEKPTPTQMDDMAFELYKRHAGEVEARNVEKRMDYDPQQMLAEHPPTTSDVPPEKQVVRQPGDPTIGVPRDLVSSKPPRLELPDIEEPEVMRSAPKALKWVQDVVTPSLRAGGQEAAASIRAASGQAARDKAITMDKLEPYQRTINAMSDAERFDFLKYIEGRSKGVQLSDPSLQGLADVLRDGFLRRQAKLSAMPSHMMMQFVDDYFPHFWDDPAAAQRVGHQFAGPIGKQGSSASLRKRLVPTIADGIAMGLTPLSTNPLEMTARYITSMDNFIARVEVVEAAKANGTITFPSRKQIGASGHPQSGQLPRADLVPVKGVFKDDVQGVAPEDWARVYNNYVGQRWGGNVEAQNFLDTIQKGSNQITAFELGVSGFHLFTMASEAFIGEFARGFANLAGGEITRGLGAIGKAVYAPVHLARTGAKGADVYLDRSPGSQNTRKLIDLITRAGGRMVGKEHASDYEFSAMGNFFTAWKRGALKLELREAASRVKGPWSGAKEAFSLVGKAFETIAYPLFVKYIPALKNGAGMELLGDWLHANPTATYEEQLAMARKIWDSIDNRFGEMVQTNLFWNKSLTQLMQIGLRSFSWTLGTIREVGGGGLASVQSVFGRAVTGKGPSYHEQLSISSPDFNPKVGYVLALPMGSAIIGMAYMFLKTGQMPGDLGETQHPKTGGEVPGFGGRGEVPELAQLPSYQKDVYGWAHNPKEEALGKLSTGPQVAGKMISGALSGFRDETDYQGRPIGNPEDPVYARILDYFKWVGESMVPISVKALFQGQKEGSNISMPESMLGIRPAPMYEQDPEGYERGMGVIRKQRFKRGQKSKARQQRQYGGTEE